MGRVAPAPTPSDVLPRAAPGWTISRVGASGLAAASAALLLLYLTGRFLWVYNKDAGSAAEDTGAAFSSSSAAAVAAAGDVTSPRLAALPALTPMGAGRAQAECAVCLTEVVPPMDSGRLLPGCGHGFHEECIATWLRHNSTCPLCRAVAK